jgi:alkanesulfonate monooxygenase SsuD/methylene tetrahydromethanopterin reductase-like flavin-dependent oxidoreductase (luciferase family)
MQIVVGPYGMQSPHIRRRPHPDMYEDLIVHARRIEELGFDGIALTEHSFWYDGYCPSLLTTLGAVAANTTRLKLVTGALLVPQHDPLKVAEEAAVVDRISNGRLVLGLGAGYRPEEFHGHGVEVGRIGARYLEAFEVVRRALHEETFSFDGEFYSYRDVSLKTRPVQRQVPMWVCAGFADWSVKAAARRGWSYCTTGDINGGLAVFDRIDEFARGFGRDPKTLKRALFRDVMLMPTQAEADVVANEEYWPSNADQFIGFGFFRMKNPDGTQMTEPPPGFREQWLGNRFGRPRGNAAEVRRQFEPLLQRDLDMLIVRLGWAGFDSARQMKSLEVFAREVMPMLREAERPR